MSIRTLYLLLIQKKAILIRVKQLDSKIAVCKPHKNGSLLLSVQKKVTVGQWFLLM